MKKKDKRVIWIIGAEAASDGNNHFLINYLPEERSSSLLTSEPLIKIKYGRTTWLKEAESATTVYRMKIPRGRPRRSE